MWIVFSISVALLAYAYAGYPALIWLLAGLRGRPAGKGRFEGGVSVLIAAHNEAATLPRKLENLLALAKSEPIREIWIGLDGCTDGTGELAKERIQNSEFRIQDGANLQPPTGNLQPSIHILDFDRRRGKAAVLNKLMEKAAQPILVMMDARQRVEEGAISRLLENFADAQVGVVSGALVYESAEGGAQKGAESYWGYEKFIRRCESRFWAVPGATGARVRVDTGFRAGDEVSPYYDPMLAKLIVWGEDRAAACAALSAALGECEVAGVATNVGLLERVVAHDAFASGRVDTGLIDKHREVLFPPLGAVPERALVAAALAEFEALRARATDAAQASVDAHSPWNACDGWWPNRAPFGVAALFADGDAQHATVVHPCGEGAARVVLPGRALDVTWTMRQGRLTIEAGDARFGASVVSDGEERLVFAPGTRRRLRLVDPLAHAGEVQEHAGHLAAPMSGAIVAVHVKPGDRVERGAPLVVLEAMKMEHTIVAPAPGVVVAVNCAVGERVSEGADLVDLEDPPA